MNVKPLGLNVLIEPIEAKSKTNSGLFIPEQAQEKPHEGIVRVLGTGGKDAKGNQIEFEVKVGDRVLLAKYGTIELTLDNKIYKLANIEDILAVLS